MESDADTFFRLSLAYHDCYRDPYALNSYRGLNSGPNPLQEGGWFHAVVAGLNPQADSPAPSQLKGTPGGGEGRPATSHPDGCASPNPSPLPPLPQEGSGEGSSPGKMGKAGGAETTAEGRGQPQVAVPARWGVSLSDTTSSEYTTRSSATFSSTTSSSSSSSKEKAKEKARPGATGEGLSPGRPAGEGGPVRPSSSPKTSPDPTQPRGAFAEERAGWPPLGMAADSVEKIVDGIQQCGIKAIALDDMRQQLIEAFHLVDHKKPKGGDAKGGTTELSESARAELAGTLYTLRAHLQRLQTSLTEQDSQRKRRQELPRDSGVKNKHAKKKITVEIIHDYEKEPLPYKKPPFRKMICPTNHNSRHGSESKKIKVMTLNGSVASDSYTPFESQSYSLVEDYVSEKKDRKSPTSVSEYTRSVESSSLESSSRSSSRRHSALSLVSSTLTSKSSSLASSSSSRSVSSTTTSSRDRRRGKKITPQGAAKGGRISSDSSSQSDSSAENLFWKRRANALKRRY